MMAPAARVTSRSTTAVLRHKPHLASLRASRKRSLISNTHSHYDAILRPTFGCGDATLQTRWRGVAGSFTGGRALGERTSSGSAEQPRSRGERGDVSLSLSRRRLGRRCLDSDRSQWQLNVFWTSSGSWDSDSDDRAKQRERGPVTPESIIRRQFPHHADVATAPQLGSQDELPKFNDVEVLRALFARVAQNHRVRMVWIWVQIVANLLSLALYVWSTYVTDKSNLWLQGMEVGCCLVFAAQFAGSIVLASNWWRKLFTPSMLLDPITWAPTLIEYAIEGIQPGFMPDFRWLRVFRSLRVLRMGLVSGPNAWKTGTQDFSQSPGQRFLPGINFVLFQIMASLFTLLYTCASIVQFIEQVDWHDSLYFIVTTFTTVGYGDIVPMSVMSRLTVCGMMLVGVVLIPVRASQLYVQLSRIKEVIGPVPSRKQPFVLVTSSLRDMKTFEDFFFEFFHELDASHLPSSSRMLYLSSAKPSLELKTFQEVNEQFMTVMQGSAVNEVDLINARAECAEAVLVLGDRFNPNIGDEDSKIMFKVLAIKSYTKCVPLYVQSLREDSVTKLASFLDEDQDVIVSVEKIRYSTLALNCICPGSSTLINNLLRRAEISVEKRDEEKMGNREWLRGYANGCAYGIYQAKFGASLIGEPFLNVADAIYQGSNCLLIGIICPNDGVLLNPGRLRLRYGDKAIVLARSIEEATGSVQIEYSSDEPVPSEICVAADLLDQCHSQVRPSQSRVDPPNSAEDSSDEEIFTVHNPIYDKWAASSPAAARELKAATPDGNGRAGNGVGWMRQDEFGLESFEVDANATYDPEILVLDGDSADMASLDEGGQDLLHGRGHLFLLSMWTSNCERGKVLCVNSGRDVSRDMWRVAELGEIRSNSTRNSSLRAAIAPAPHRETRNDQTGTPVSPLRSMTGHFILCGSPASMPGFLGALGRCDPTPTKPTVVVVSPDRPPRKILARLEELAEVHFCQGDPSDQTVLESINSTEASALVYLSEAHQPFDDLEASEDESSDTSGFVPAAVAHVADAEALLVCYGVGGENNKGDLLHSVVELGFTSSVRFLQSGLNIRGHTRHSSAEKARRPRQSWAMRKLQEQAALAEGLASWQVNPYFASGRVMVPASIDTFTCECFFNNGVMVDILTELCGDDGRLGGAVLRQLRVPDELIGRTYGELARELTLRGEVVPLGLYRRKHEDRVWKLPYVATNPPPGTELLYHDRVFILRKRTWDAE